MTTAPSEGAVSSHSKAEAAPRAETERASKNPAKPRRMSRRTKLLIGAGVAAVAIAAGAYYLYSRGYESTDDAEIDGNISAISARVAGTVRAVYVEDNRRVGEGDVLVDLDPADLDVAVAQARAQLEQARAELQAEHPNVPITVTTDETQRSTAAADLESSQASLAAARADMEQLSAQLLQAAANDRTAQVEQGRSAKLLVAGATTASDFDLHADNATASAANMEALRHAIASARYRERENVAKVTQARARLAEVKSNAPRQEEAHRATLAVREANVQTAEAQLAQAELNRSYATIRAPVTGIIGKKTVSVGDRVSPGQELMALSDTSNVWVTANFRETQTKRMHPGQAVRVHVDALGADFRGKLENLGGATGSRYSVLPPENATGNYVKVVQRIPVRIDLDADQPGWERLRLGMSVEPKVKLR